MHLVCHATIPGTGYSIGEVVSDPKAIAEISANPALKAHFGSVPDGTFPPFVPSAPASPPPPKPAA